MRAGFVWAYRVRALQSAHRSPDHPRTQCKNNLKQIALALHNYNDQYGALPPAYTVDENGTPLHSWRTFILPFLEQKPLYDKIDLTKAWDDPVNAEAYKSTIWAYRCPSADGPETHTTYLAVVTSNSCLRAAEPRLLSEITDGTANTLMVIEADLEHAVHWMSPMDADESLIMAISETSIPPTMAVRAIRHARTMDISRILKFPL